MGFVGRSSVARSLCARGAELCVRVQALVGAAFGSARQRGMAVSEALLVDGRGLRVPDLEAAQALIAAFVFPGAR